MRVPISSYELSSPHCVLPVVVHNLYSFIVYKPGSSEYLSGLTELSPVETSVREGVSCVTDHKIFKTHIFQMYQLIYDESAC